MKEQELSPWMKLLGRQKDTEDFSMLVHNYYKLALMRVMQYVRSKYEIPPEDLQTLVIAICSRMLNESVYSVGANFKDGYGITEIYAKDHLLNLVKVLNGEPLSKEERTDIDTDIQSGLNKFKQFILENGKEFHL